MTRARLVNLLDDFSIGGVTRGLSIFGMPEVRSVADCDIHAIKPDAVIAPTLKADIIITHFPANWRRLAFFASLRLRNPQAKIIHVEHSYSAEWAALHVPHPRRFRLMLSLATRMVDQLVCVSAAQQSWMISASGAAPDKIAMIHPFSRQPGLQSLYYPDFDTPAPLVVGAYGRFHESKGFEALIDAFKALGPTAHVRLLLGGFGPDEAALKRRAADCPAIRFAGKITDVATYLTQVDVVAVPSRYETYGQVANEAREAGRPILVSKAGGLPEQVGDAGLIVDCTDPKALIEALSTLRNQPLAAMARAGRAATEGCGQERARQWAALIKNVMNPVSQQREAKTGHAYQVT